MLHGCCTVWLSTGKTNYMNFSATGNANYQYNTTYNASKLNSSLKRWHELIEENQTVDDSDDDDVMATFAVDGNENSITFYGEDYDDGDDDY